MYCHCVYLNMAETQRVFVSEVNLWQKVVVAADPLVVEDIILAKRVAVVRLVAVVLRQ